MPNLKKAELLEGVVHMPAAALRWFQHGNPHFGLITWLGIYAANRPGIHGGDNEPQPDAALIIDPACGGQASVSDHVEGAPEWVGEIASSSASFDRNVKFRVYRRSRVREYLVWRILDRAVDWFTLHEDDYQPLPVADGIQKSEIFPGLWLAPEALIRMDLPSVLEVLQRGLASSEHAAFAGRLAAARQ